MPWIEGRATNPPTKQEKTMARAKKAPAAKKAAGKKARARKTPAGRSPTASLTKASKTAPRGKTRTKRGKGKKRVYPLTMTDATGRKVGTVSRKGNPFTAQGFMDAGVKLALLAAGAYPSEKARDWIVVKLAEQNVTGTWLGVAELGAAFAGLLVGDMVAPGGTVRFGGKNVDVTPAIYGFLAPLASAGVDTLVQSLMPASGNFYPQGYQPSFPQYGQGMGNSLAALNQMQGSYALPGPAGGGAPIQNAMQGGVAGYGSGYGQSRMM